MGTTNEILKCKEENVEDMDVPFEKDGTKWIRCVRDICYSVWVYENDQAA